MLYKFVKIKPTQLKIIIQGKTVLVSEQLVYISIYAREVLLLNVCLLCFLRNILKSMLSEKDGKFEQ